MLPQLRENTLDVMVDNHYDLKLARKFVKEAFALFRQSNKWTRAKPEPGAKRDMRQESLHLRLQQQSGQLEQPSRLRLLRRDVAKIETVLAQRVAKTEAAKAEKK